MTTALAIKQELTAEQIELLKKQICKGATDDELKLFISRCNRTGLDPFARQIYSIERRECVGTDSYGNKKWVTKRSIQISIDGARLVAQRTGQYEGQTPPMWCDKDGIWVDVWLKDTPPAAAKVGVYRTGFKEPCYGIALFKEYVPKDRNGNITKFWATMPSLMIAKVAEALALRKAFPQELSGLYTTEEMSQADNEKKKPQSVVIEVDENTPRLEPLIPGRAEEIAAEFDKQQRAELEMKAYQLMDELELTDEQKLKGIQHYGGTNAEFVEVLTDEQLKKMLTALKTKKTKKENAA